VVAQNPPTQAGFFGGSQRDAIGSGGERNEPKGPNQCQITVPKGDRTTRLVWHLIYGAQGAYPNCCTSADSGTLFSGWFVNCKETCNRFSL